MWCENKTKILGNWGTPNGRLRFSSVPCRLKKISCGCVAWGSQYRGKMTFTPRECHMEPPRNSFLSEDFAVGNGSLFGCVLCFQGSPSICGVKQPCSPVFVLQRQIHRAACRLCIQNLECLGDRIQVSGFFSCSPQEIETRCPNVSESRRCANSRQTQDFEWYENTLPLNPLL